MKPKFIAVAWLAALAVPVRAQAPPAERAIEIGFEQRVRNENWNNLMDFRSSADDEREQIRIRTRAWASVPLVKGISFYVGLNTEANERVDKDAYFDEVLVENLYVHFERLGVPGLSLRVGRQNLARGEGFLLLEGTAGDGSRTTCFNGLDLSYRFRRSNLELIGISNPSGDRYLPVLHDQHKLLQNWDEQALGLYYTDQNLGATTLEGYWFYKREIHDRLAAGNPQHQDDRFLHTAGGRISHPLTRNWLVVGELAAQRGHQAGGRSIHAGAGYAYLKRSLEWKWPAYFQGGYIGLSGSDPARPNVIGNWDPLFSRWPKWSELYIYSQVPEVGVAYWTNTNMVTFEGGVRPSRRLKMRATYYRMGAYHPFPGNRANFSTGLFRGHNMQARVDFGITRNMAGHVLYERMLPGTFYTGRSPAYFLRFETSIVLKTLIPVGRNGTTGKQR